METSQKTSRLSGFHRLSIEERRARIAQWLEEDGQELDRILEEGGLSQDDADTLVENALGRHALPFSVAANFRIDDRDVLVPMVIEEPSVVAAAGNAARLVRSGGGFHTKVDPPVMACQIQLFASDIEAARERILEEKQALMEIAAKADPLLRKLGGGPQDIEVRVIPDPDDRPFLVIHLLVDVRDAMGANAVNTMGETLAEPLRKITGGETGLRILSNLADRRLVRVEALVSLSALEMPDFKAESVRDGIVSASRFAELDPYRAATHNKGIMNGLDAVLLATGNDWRAVEAGAHAYAARSGKYAALATWRITENGDLHGRLKLPVAVGIVGGMTRIHECTQLALRLLEVRNATDLAAIAASAGLASNLAALRALSTEGIQKGHMRLHARSRDLEKS